jgi:RNA polymerase sigma-70 factor, ECF subfamily
VRSTSGKRPRRRKGYGESFRAELGRLAAPGSDGGTSPSTRAEERALIVAARGGDRRALSNLLTQLTGPVYRYGRVFCGDPHDAEDVTQVVLAALARTLSEFRGESSLTTWAYSVARHACARQRRLRAGAPAAFIPIQEIAARSRGLEPEDQSQDPHRSLERARLAEALESAIQALPASQREVLVLRDVEGLSAAEVGKALRLTERVVKARLHRARVALRHALASWGPQGSAGASSGRCRATVRHISEYVEGNLSKVSCADLQAHVESCADCAAACREVRQILGACRNLRVSSVPHEVRAAIRGALRKALAGQG